MVTSVTFLLGCWLGCFLGLFLAGALSTARGEDSAPATEAAAFPLRSPQGGLTLVDEAKL